MYDCRAKGEEVRIITTLEHPKFGWVGAASPNKATRAGFTLVEVIVVLVIIAILAAISIPALTGYIDKAQDKQYMATARNYNTAAHVVLDEDYAGGYLPSTSTNVSTYDSANFALWHLNNLSESATKTKSGYANRVADLIGEKHPSSTGSSGYWILSIIGSKGSTALNADGFLFYYFPEENVAGKPMIVVTYKLDRWNVPDGANRDAFDNALPLNGRYNSNAGYEIYNLVR
jgi:prepilin-type N-terminal cleavage/methylation domain-containing protein